VDIRRLAPLAFPGVERKACESIACDHFLDALADPELALKIRERQLSSLDSALQIALQLEVWTTDTTRLKEATKSNSSEPRRVREISQPAEPSNETFQKEMEKRFVELESRVARSNSYDLRTPMDPIDTAILFVMRTRTRIPIRISNQNQNQSSTANSNLNCFRCGDAMHLVRDCPLAGADAQTPCTDSRRPPPPQPQQNVRPMKCWSNRPNKACIWIIIIIAKS